MMKSILIFAFLTACGGDDGSTTSSTTTATGTTTSTTSTTTTASNTINECWSLNFDGVDDYVELTNAVDHNGDYTVEFWFMPTEAYGWDMVIGTGENNTGSFAICGNEGCDGWGGDDYAFKWDNGGRIDSSVGIKIGEWHHVAGVQSGGEATLYINGEIAGTGSAQDAGSIGPPVIGDEAPESSHAYEGLVGSYRFSSAVIYGSEFSPETALSVEGDTEVLLSMNEGTGIMAYDSSSNNNGTIDGATWIEECPE